MAVLKADPQARRKALYIFLIFCILLFVIIHWGLPEFNAFLKQKQPQEALHILLIALSITFLSVLPIAAYLYRYGHRILEAGQLPPPGTKVTSDTEIVTGDAARRRARILIILSFIIALGSLLGGLYVSYSLYKSFENHKIKQKTGEVLKMKIADTAMLHVEYIDLQKMNTH